jgi:hypothetical protein
VFFFVLILPISRLVPSGAQNTGFAVRFSLSSLHGLVLLAGLISLPSSSCALRLDEYIRTAGEDFLTSHVLRYFFVNFRPVNLTNPPNLATTRAFYNLTRWAFPRGRADVLDILAKRFFSMQYFLTETDAHWFYSGLDHSIINFRLLRPFLQSLATAHSPTRDFVVYGQCVFSQDQVYPQGGSGIIMTRFAARAILDALRRGDLAMGGMDDMALGHILRHFRYPPFQMTHPAFSGYHFDGDTSRAIIDGNFAGFRTCASRIRAQLEGMCRPFVAPLRDVVFFHVDGTQDIEWMLTLSDAVFRAPERVSYSVVGYRPELCVRPWIAL